MESEGLRAASSPASRSSWGTGDQSWPVVWSQSCKELPGGTGACGQGWSDSGQDHSLILHIDGAAPQY